MRSLIDIHTHILPGLDDGASDAEASLLMAKAAFADGITALIATPHHANGVYLNEAKAVRGHVQALSRLLEEAGLPLDIYPGQEIRVNDGLLDAWQKGELLPLADSSYILLEMPSSHIPKGMGELVHELGVMGLCPIIAHPERNAEAANEPERLEELLELGAYAQVTAHSLLGGFGRRIEQHAWRLMKQGLIHVVASDAHHVDSRGFRLGEAYRLIERTMGEQWPAYMQANAAAVLTNAPIGDKQNLLPAQPGRFRRLFSFRRNTNNH